MNDTELETELKKLRPRPASELLTERIGADLERAGPAHSTTRNGAVGWLRKLFAPFAVAGACAAVAVALQLERTDNVAPPTAPTAAAQDDFEPRSSSYELVSVNDRGLFVREDQ